MRDDLPLRVANANVHSKVFDDEVVIIDMVSGIYYSVRGAGVAIWTLVEAGAAPVDIVAALAARFEAPAETLAQAARVFLGQLAEQGLIVADDAAPRAAAPPPGTEPRVQFAAPQLERFTDMQDLLLLDPIHEVGEAGWPHGPVPGRD
jgi:hypothetical protein